MKKQSLLHFISLFLISTLFLDCTPKDEPLECYICTYTNLLPPDCMDSYNIDMCILRPHEQSAQSILSIEVYCNGVLQSTNENITFPEDFFAEQANAGGMCEPK